EDEGKVSVADVLPVPVGLPDDVVFTSGDIIVKLQDESVTSISDLDTRYSGIATGDEVVFELLRDGETRTFNFAKPAAPEGQIMMKKQ
ncbi:MAG: PDZ domain-containing protein, partial [FCB group bacterium]|nr:PDZ domain-containing protein [FCB group bacterium]